MDENILKIILPEIESNERHTFAHFDSFAWMTSEIRSGLDDNQKTCLAAKIAFRL